VPNHREAEALLARWREIERSLAVADPGSDEAERLIADAALLRNEYQRRVQEAIDEDEPAPPALPEPIDAS
jgi:hypothetical protein